MPMPLGICAHPKSQSIPSRRPHPTVRPSGWELTVRPRRRRHSKWLNRFSTSARLSPREMVEFGDASLQEGSPRLDCIEIEFVQRCYPPKLVPNEFPKHFSGHVTHYMTSVNILKSFVKSCNSFFAGLLLEKVDYMKRKIC